MNSPMVSVVVPVYNAGEYLSPMVESVLAQSLSDLELILVDGGSTPQDAANCDAWAKRDARIRVLHRENEGALGGRAAGFAVSRGEYVLFVDCDDLLNPNILQVLTGLCQDTGLDCACCRFVPFSGTVPAGENKEPSVQRLDAPRHLDALLHHAGVSYSLCNKLYRRTLLANADFSAPIAYNEDLLVNWWLLPHASGIVYTDFVGYYYRQHGQSASHRPLSDKSIADQLLVACTIRDDAQHGPLKESAWAFYYEKLLYLDSMILRRNNAGDYIKRHEELVQLIRQDLRRALKNPQLALTFKLTAPLACWLEPVWRLLCRTLLTDRR